MEWPSESDRPQQGGAGYDYPEQTRSDRSRAGRAGSSGQRPGRDGWTQSDPFTGGDDETDLPPWAGPSIHATRAGGTKLRPPVPEVAEQAPAAPGERPTRRRGRAAAARLRKSRRRVFVWCCSAIVIAVVVAGVAIIKGLHKPAPHTGFVTTLQAGEYRTVPSACSSVSSALLSQALPGKSRKVTPISTSGATSQCSFTVDSKPVFRVLEITIQAFQPSAVAAGNGSATSNATDAFTLTRLQLAHPPKKSPLPPAQISAATGLPGSAFSALQLIHSSAVRTDLVTVLTRQRNVVVTVSLQAQASGNGFGPVSTSDVQSVAAAVARGVMGTVRSHPAVKA